MPGSCAGEPSGGTSTPPGAGRLGRYGNRSREIRPRAAVDGTGQSGCGNFLRPLSGTPLATQPSGRRPPSSALQLSTTRTPPSPRPADEPPINYAHLFGARSESSSAWESEFTALVKPFESAGIAMAQLGGEGAGGRGSLP